MTSSRPSRGEVWIVGLDPVKERPALVISADMFNQGPADLAVVIPITIKHKGIPFHVGIEPPEGGLRTTSYVKCEDVRSLSAARLVNRLGSVTEETLAQVEDRLRILMGL